MKNVKKCGDFPIKGILYECSKCKGYYLCEKCEEINYIDKKHPHNFIKIRKEKKKYEIGEKKNVKINQKNKIIFLNYF